MDCVPHVARHHNDVKLRVCPARLRPVELYARRLPVDAQHATTRRRPRRVEFLSRALFDGVELFIIFFRAQVHRDLATLLLVVLEGAVESEPLDVSWIVLHLPREVVGKGEGHPKLALVRVEDVLCGERIYLHVLIDRGVMLREEDHQLERGEQEHDVNDSERETPTCEALHFRQASDVE